MQNQTKFVSCHGLEAMVSIEGQVSDKHSFYYPEVVLIYPAKGTIHLEIDQKTQVIPPGNFVLINKHMNGFIRKTWTEAEGEALLYAFIFQQAFIEKVRQRFDSKIDSQAGSPENLYVLPPNHILKGLFDSISSYLNQEQEINPHLVELKTLEAMLGVLDYHPECYQLFLQDNQKEKIDLQQLVEKNYMLNIPLSQFAKLSGRSLSTFSRDFKAIYKESPHRWILKRRLLKAKEYLMLTNRKPAEFYLELGFESLAHFSRAFKKEFGMTMTDFRKKNQSKLT
jgi:AraC-like DNA-binding protein